MIFWVPSVIPSSPAIDCHSQGTGLTLSLLSLFFPLPPLPYKYRTRCCCCRYCSCICTSRSTYTLVGTLLLHVPAPSLALHTDRTSSALPCLTYLTYARSPYYIGCTILGSFFKQTSLPVFLSFGTAQSALVLLACCETGGDLSQQPLRITQDGYQTKPGAERETRRDRDRQH